MSLLQLLEDIDRFPLSGYVTCQGPVINFDIHRHEKQQLGFIGSGSAYLTIDSKLYLIPANHFFWIPSNIPHSMACHLLTSSAVFIYYNGSQDEYHPFYSRFGVYRASTLLTEMITFVGSWNENQIKPLEFNWEFTNTLKKLVSVMAPHTKPLFLPTTQDPLMEKIIEYLHGHFDKILYLETVSKRFGISIRTLSRLFQSTLQISFLQYLKALRLMKAFELVAETRLSVSEIAMKVGYNSVGSFSNAFYAAMGIRPFDLRNVCH